jgi:hypothetical protein
VCKKTALQNDKKNVIPMKMGIQEAKRNGTQIKDFENVKTIALN